LDIIGVALIVLLGWFWYDGSLAKEVAMRAARRACERHGQQLLDETVVLGRLRPQRDRSGRMRWWRLYRFEFSGDGERRSSGEVTLLGRRIMGLTLALDGHTLYDQHNQETPPRYH